MNVANMATYPARRGCLQQVIERVHPQLDRLNLVLNEYREVPAELDRFDRLNPIIPEEDTKDVGKFLPVVDDEDHVFLLDDDLLYPPDFVETALKKYAGFNCDKVLVGFHGSIYYRKPKRKFHQRARVQLRRIMGQPTLKAHWRKVYWFKKALDEPIIVEQIATNAAMSLGKNIPGFDYMKTSQKFVDVRLARWCHDHGIKQICLDHDADYLEAVGYEETIFQNFTRKTPRHVLLEIETFATKVAGAGRNPFDHVGRSSLDSPG